jgi:hypothetical protein
VSAKLANGSIAVTDSLVTVISFENTSSKAPVYYVAVSTAAYTSIVYSVPVEIGGSKIVHLFQLDHPMEKSTLIELKALSNA